jgi:hypothetical protein
VTPGSDALPLASLPQDAFQNSSARWAPGPGTLELAVADGVTAANGLEYVVSVWVQNQLGPQVSPPPPLPLVLSGHAASLTPY